MKTQVSAPPSATCGGTVRILPPSSPNTLLSCLDQASQNNADSNAGWHIPRVRARDNFYAKLEKERIEAQKELLARVAASSSS